MADPEPLRAVAYAPVAKHDQPERRILDLFEVAIQRELERAHSRSLGRSWESGH